MEIAIFAKKRTNKEGRVFYNFLSTLKRKDGTEQPVTVKFGGDAKEPKPEDCPMNIVFRREDANAAKRTYTDEQTGELKTAYTLWLKAYRIGEPYIDHSLDEFAD